MKEFFKKYPHEATEIDAIEMIHDSVERAKKSYKKGEDCYRDLAYSFAMLEDFFNEKGINPRIYV